MDWPPLLDPILLDLDWIVDRSVAVESMRLQFTAKLDTSSTTSPSLDNLAADDKKCSSGKYGTAVIYTCN